MYIFIMTLFVVLAFPICSFLHECGHLLASKLLSIKVDRVQIGTGKPFFNLKLGSVEVQFNWNSFLGGLTLITDGEQHPKWKRLFFIFSGTIVSFALYIGLTELLGLITATNANVYLVNGLYIFSVLNGYMAIVQLFPYRKNVSRQHAGYPSDGLALVHLTRPSNRKAN